MKRVMTLAALAAALAATFAATPANAAVSSASIDGPTATLNLDGANDNVTVSVSGGLLVHGQTTGDLNSAADWDSATPGDQTVPADGTRTVIVAPSKTTTDCPVSTSEAVRTRSLPISWTVAGKR